MNIYKRVHAQSARDKLKELVEMHGHELFIARALLLRISEEECESLLDDIRVQRLYPLRFAGPPHTVAPTPHETSAVFVPSSDHIPN